MGNTRHECILGIRWRASNASRAVGPKEACGVPVHRSAIISLSICFIRLGHERLMSPFRGIYYSFGVFGLFSAWHFRAWRASLSCPTYVYTVGHRLHKSHHHHPRRCDDSGIQHAIEREREIRPTEPQSLLFVAVTATCFDWNPSEELPHSLFHPSKGSTLLDSYIILLV